MKIDEVDFFYLSMPEILDVADGSQDALLVRVEADGRVGWGECEASPLVSIANWVCPMSHAACRPVRDAVLGQKLEQPGDIERIHRVVRQQGLDIAQTDHTLSGVDIALWDLLGKKLEQPVYELLGVKKALPKVPYASTLFGDEPSATIEKARDAVRAGYQAVKFGWGSFGKGDVTDDRDHLAAAREGLGSDRRLLVDAGTVWEDSLEKAVRRLSALQEFGVVWLEEPFVSEALQAYQSLARQSGPVALAAGEGARTFHMARNLIDYGGIGFVQIDTGRIGGITPARRVARYAHETGKAVYVNHTFTTHLALSASLQPYAGLAGHDLCEYPVAPSELARGLTAPVLAPGADGLVRVPEAPGLGIEPDPATIRKFLVPVEIIVGGERLYQTPDSHSSPN